MASFHNMTHQEIKVYVDGMIAKLREGENLVETLRKLFERLKKILIEA
jgi:allantoicase